MYLLKKGDFNSFAESLISRYDVVAPVRQDIVRFKKLERGDGISGKVVFEPPLYPAKDFFLTQRDPFYHFRNAKVGLPQKKAKRKTVFFMNRCDINAVHRNDMIMLDEPADPNYKEKRENAVLVEVPCVVLDRCNCINIGHVDCYDLRLIDTGKNGDYVVDAATERGMELIKDMHLQQAEMKKEEIQHAEPKSIREDNREIWEKYGKECLSCSACNVVCPTCTCFTISGDMKLNCKEGTLYREWASCQLLEFTKVAGGFVFRRDRGARGKQRLHCKFQYFRQKFGHNRCVGCGRCNDACPVGINIFNYFSELK